MARHFLWILVCLFPFHSAAGSVVISEINFHPRPADDALEFVELANNSATPEDISGYSFVEGITFVFPPGTILEGRGFLVVCADAAALKAHYGITNALGNYGGRLDNGGERITLVNHAGIPVQSVQFRDSGKWPIGPDGTGHTLILRNVYLDPKEPESWIQSPELEGSPGLSNFPSDEPQVVQRVLIDRGAAWSYQKGTAPFSTPAAAWLDPAFDDGGWPIGPAGFGFGDDDDETVLSDMQGSYTSVACRIRFLLSAADLAGDGQFFFGVDYDDGFCAYLNGNEVGRANCGQAGSIPVWDGVASASRESGNETLFPIPGNALRLGENVLCVAGYNLTAASTDFSLVPRLLFRETTSPGSRVIETALVDRGETWRYRKGTAAFSAPASAWRSPGFDDSAWLSGPSGFGFQVSGAATAAYVVPVGTLGNQNFGGPLGMDFEVLQDIEVARLGVFDSGSDGLALTIVARLYDRASLKSLASLQFSPASPGDLVGGSRFKPLPAPLLLRAGFQGVIVAEGYGDAELNGNQGSAPLGLLTQDGGGALSFSGGGRYGDPASPGAFPNLPDSGPADRYAAGTFEFQRPGAGGGAPHAPPGVLTLLSDMPGGYTSIASRRTFTLTAEDLASPGEYYLGVDFQDGFCAFVNGQEAARVNCGNPGDEPLAGGVASAERGAGQEQVFAISKDLLVEGENLLAIAGYSTGVDADSMKLVMRFFRRQVTVAGGGPSLAFNELHRGGAPRSGWVELYNSANVPVDVSGFTLTDDVTRTDPYQLPAGTLVPAKGFLVVTEADSTLLLSTEKVQVFLRDPVGLVAAAATFDRLPPAGVALGSYSEERFPDGGPLDWVSLTPTPGAANQVESEDSIVINEIFYHPPLDRDDEFIELLNRGDTEVDLTGCAFDQGIDYSIPDGTRLAPGAYLVIAKNPALLAENHEVQALGPYRGVLSDKGESVRLLDRMGNPIDRVRYIDGGRWSRWADGDGSSLELIDPDQDNSIASAWTASDESEKAAWERLSFNVPAYVTAAESELHFYLTQRGTCLIDDVAIQRDGGPNLIPNPGFEAGTTPWIIEGTHVRSRRTVEDSHTGTACLQVIASGKGDTTVNRIETDTNPRLTAGAYDVSLWARWQQGSSLFVVHGEYSKGPYRVTPCFTCGVPEPNLSGNPLAAALRMSIPLDLGTPGRENSATRLLREATGGRNLGPVIDQVINEPPAPEPAEPAVIIARIGDAQGVASAKVLYRVGNAGGPFDEAPLSDDGLNGDGQAGDGIYGGQIPGFAQLTRVVFYVEATDTAGAVRRFPVEAPDKTCLYMVQAPLTDRLDRYNFFLDTQRTAELQTRQLHSNDLVEGSFIFDDKQVFYDVGVRYRGSPWGRPGRGSFRVRFPEDDLFHGGRRDVNISKTGANSSEGLTHFLIGRNAALYKPSPATEYIWVKAWFNGSSLGNKGSVESIDADFVEKWYGEGSVGPLLKAFGRFVFNDGGGLVGQNGWEGASFIYRGENPENYRGYYVQSMEQDEDNWEPLFELTRLLDSQTTNAVLDQNVAKWVDMESFLRVYGARALMGDGDAFGINNGHNGYLVFDSLRGLWGILAFDNEAAFWTAAPDLFASADPAVTRLLSRPEPRRNYLRTLWEFSNGYWSAAVAKPYLDAVQKATGLATGSVLSFVGSSSTRVKSIVQPYLTQKVRIITNGGNDITTEEPMVELEGDAPVSVSSLIYMRSTDEPVVFTPAWTSPTRWKAQVALRGGRNDIEIQGYDVYGKLVGSAQIGVTYRPNGFVRGDPTGDFVTDIGDAILVLFHLYGGLSLPCPDAADFDDGGSIDLTDVIGVLEYLFRAGPAPASPFPDPGEDVGNDALPDCNLEA